MKSLLQESHVEKMDGEEEEEGTLQLTFSPLCCSIHWFCSSSLWKTATLVTFVPDISGSAQCGISQRQKKMDLFTSYDIWAVPTSRERFPPHIFWPTTQPELRWHVAFAKDSSSICHLSSATIIWGGLGHMLPQLWSDWKSSETSTSCFTTTTGTTRKLCKTPLRFSREFTVEYQWGNDLQLSSRTE